MADLVKRQHFVPRTYLKHFAVEKGQEYTISVLPSNEETAHKIFETNIKNIAIERNLYTLPGKSIEQKMAVEKFYSDEFEQHYNTIYNILIDSEKNKISQAERELIISTVVTMYYRTTKWVNASRGLMSRVFDQVFLLCKQTGKDYFTFEGEKISIAGRTLEEFTKDYNDERQPGMILAQLEVALKLIPLRLKNDAIMVVKLDEGDEFVTSDNPVIASNLSEKRFMPFDPQNTLKLPLDNKHILMLIPEGIAGQENLIFRKTSKAAFSTMDKLVGNFQQMNNSEKFIFGSKTALESYLKTKKETESPIHEEDKKLESIADFLKRIDELKK
ncbi:uncharacterized protein DUF4238 [Flavobacterium araucananum]|uniref:DUF4238 domain-containing protein n=1 Tax=Flavobacterium araucananum TaxID=946678 RepID=A0A227PFA3_9FLAO|nr:DUF4238 domain-containing protein [Flavobacterium araucananum]OXG07836.1 hypothetical protein B0A64_07545 [Flavobacterium araucananum]PWJ90654.1 uncharacterized protein DUF4238 [Flavobacterium araucananum]